jgi:UDP-N-acetylglucosamine 2-epimerase (non-hydrolysing)
MIIFGTRPEAIKMAPVILGCHEHPDIAPIVCSTGQHREMLDQVLSYFDIKPDVDLGLMKPGQTLSGLTAQCITAVDQQIQNVNPDCIVVQGDTTTVMAAAMVAFYHRKPIVHVEAGLRTGDLNAPWPEEFNRRVAGIVTTLHCAPTQTSADALIAEGVDPANVQVTGNTVIDALLYSVKRERSQSARWFEKYPMLDAADGNQPLVLITGHRRENFGGGLESICGAIKSLAQSYPGTRFIYPVHLNPNVQGPVHSMLGDLNNVHLVAPASYPEFVWLMDRADVVLTDSGGVQEEAPSLGAVVLVTREKTERPEAVQAGLATLVGTDANRIIDSVSGALANLKNSSKSTSMLDPATINNPYGDGKASPRIIEWMLQRLDPANQ